jgi:hypothetical protein
VTVDSHPFFELFDMWRSEQSGADAGMSGDGFDHRGSGAFAFGARRYGWRGSAGVVSRCGVSQSLDAFQPERFLADRSMCVRSRSGSYSHVMADVVGGVGGGRLAPAGSFLKFPRLV